MNRSNLELDSVKLPPHDVAAEAALLGVALSDPCQVIPNARRRFGPRKVFYDIRHANIWQALIEMSDQSKPVDVVTLHAWLAANGVAQEVGGAVYLAELISNASSPANWPEWCGLLIDKWSERQLKAVAVDVNKAIDGGVPDIDGMIRRILTDITTIETARKTSTDEPGRIKAPDSYAEDVFNIFFGAGAGVEPGTEFPFGFPFRIRECELTLCVGENGNGKSTFLNYLTMHMLSRGWKGFVTYLEEPVPHTLRTLCSQLIGTTKPSDSDEGRRRIVNALAWYQPRLRIYDFLGIVDWRTLINAMEQAAENHGCNWFVIDSLMKLGIPDDDYSQQGQAVQAFSGFAHKWKAHVVLVNHLNKSDRDAKSRSRGSAQIADNAANIIHIVRNEKKQANLAEIKERAHMSNLPLSYFADEVGQLDKEWDANLKLIKQRFSGSQQNGSAALWFIPESLQFFKETYPKPIDYLDRWKKHPLKHTAPERKESKVLA